MPTPPTKTPTAPAASAGPARQQQLLALGSAAVLTVYATGFLRTKAAADALDEGSNARRRPSAPSLPGAESAPTRAAMAFGASSPSAAAAGTRPAGKPPALPPTDDSARFTVVVKKGVAQVVARSATPDSAARPAAAVAQATAATAADASTSLTTTVAAPTAPVPAPASTPEPAPTSAASTPTSAPAPAEAPKPVGWRDGTYTGWGTSRHGDIEATVVIESGKITGAIISRCLTRYSCSWVAHLQQQVVVRQSPEVDNVSGATQSANAFFYAVSEALAKAK